MEKLCVQSYGRVMGASKTESHCRRSQYRGGTGMIESVSKEGRHGREHQKTTRDISQANIEKQESPERIRQLANRLCSKIGYLESGLKEITIKAAESSPSKPSRRPPHTLYTFLRSICHRRDHFLLENEDSEKDDGKMEFLLRTLTDAHSLAKELEGGCYHLCGKYYSLQRRISEAERNVWALAKVVEVFCAEAGTRVDQTDLERRYRMLQERCVVLERKDMKNELKIRKLEMLNQRLVGRLRELEIKVRDLSISKPRCLQQKLSLKDQHRSELDSRSSSSSTSSSSSELLCDVSGPFKKEGRMQKNEKDITHGQIGTHPDKVSLPFSTSTSIQPSVPEPKELPDNKNKTKYERYMIETDPTWFEALKAHREHWHGFRNVRDHQRKEASALYRLRMECGELTDHNKRLATRLCLSNMKSVKYHDQVNDLLNEKQRLQQRLGASNTLLQIAQRSMISPSDSSEVNGRTAVIGQ